MKLVKISEIKEYYKEVIVTDSISKKQYFQDSEIFGWILVKSNEGGIKIYHLYRCGYDQEKNEDIDEPLFFPEDLLIENDRENALNQMKEEARMQRVTRENPHLLSEIEKYIKTS